MKLIIDIPAEIVTAIQNGQDYRYDIHTVIAQGKPYDTTGDLISREALKKALAKNITIWTFNISYDGILAEVIDNAPTVERPQGEWARHDEWRNGEYIGGFYHINCPEIEKGTALFSRWETNFCPNCGAEMRGKEE